MKLRGPKTMWGKLILIIYVLSITFSLVALLITVILLSTWSFVYEAIPSARWFFSNFGLFVGAFLRGLSILVFVAGVPLIVLCLMSYLLKLEEPGSFALNLGFYLGSSIIDALAFSNVSSSFLDIYHDTSIMIFILNGNLMGASGLMGFGDLVTTIWRPVFLISLAFSFLARFARYLRGKNHVF